MRTDTAILDGALHLRRMCKSYILEELQAGLFLSPELAEPLRFLILSPTFRSQSPDGLGTNSVPVLALLVYRLVCQPVTLESRVRFPDEAAK